MSTSRTTNPTSTGERSYFEQQREILLKEIGISFEHVLQNINKLNRSLEGVIAVGNEFGSVEALWSRFEEVTEKGNGGVSRNGNGNGEKEKGRESREEEGDSSVVSREEGSGDEEEDGDRRR